MDNGTLAQLEFPRYARWLARMNSCANEMAVLDREHRLAWHNSSELAQVCEQQHEAGFNWPSQGRGMQRRDIDAASALLYIPFYSRSDTLLGTVVVGVAGDIACGMLDALAEALEDVAAAMADEHHLKVELNMMAAELSERYDELHLVYKIDEDLYAATQGDKLFHPLLKNCVDHINVDVAAFVQPGTGFCEYATNLSKPIHNLDLVLVEMRGDLFRFVNASRKTLVLNDMADQKRAYIFTDMPFKIMCCPVLNDNTVTAILVLLKHLEKPDFTNSDRRLSEILANQLSILSRLYGSLDEVGQFNEQMAAALIESVEAKDPYTRGHSERVHHISVEIGRAMHFSPTEADNLFWGSLLHDVGKIGIPDAVLCKPGRLTKDEYTFIMVHPERSYEILRHIDRFKAAVPGARHHQEKFDGTGYPHGLRGKDIPLNARIIAVADTYDSITSSRAYRAGRSHEAAMLEIERVAGTQLDPEIVEIFKQVCAKEPEWLKRFNIRREPELVQQYANN